jgi:hypothetical protein
MNRTSVCSWAAASAGRLPQEGVVRRHVPAPEPDDLDVRLIRQRPDDRQEVGHHRQRRPPGEQPRHRERRRAVVERDHLPRLDLGAHHVLGHLLLLAHLRLHPVRQIAVERPHRRARRSAADLAQEPAGLQLVEVAVNGHDAHPALLRELIDPHVPELGDAATHRLAPKVGRGVPAGSVTARHAHTRQPLTSWPPAVGAPRCRVGDFRDADVEFRCPVGCKRS